MMDDDGEWKRDNKLYEEGRIGGWMMVRDKYEMIKVGIWKD